ncbi:MAG: hypothetical protein RIQ56_457 [Candidatus Parcubacteria bacterium]|jgi:ubiquinone/menaquinone biosynthesis C-methylase UbiE
MALHKNTSWGGVADWYEEHLQGDDTYHSKVIAPNLLRLLSPLAGRRVLDVGCGDGYFTRLLHAGGAKTEGVDIAGELIEKARKKDKDIAYYVASAESLNFAASDSYDALICILALQNMEDLTKVFRECARVLKSSGTFLFVLNHPTFRIPKRSSWGWDEAQKLQYRRLDGYLSASREAISMTPGSDLSKQTWSFHRSLQDYMKALAAAGLCITKLEEWISHKQSEKGPRSAAEDKARKEFPLFMVIQVRKL